MHTEDGTTAPRGQPGSPLGRALRRTDPALADRVLRIAPRVDAQARSAWALDAVLLHLLELGLARAEADL